MTDDSSARPQDTCIILFAKYPARNKAKTRLQPALGIDGAARMARQLLLHSIDQAIDTGFSVELCVSPAPTDPCWQVLDFLNSLRWSAQADGDLGLRMLIASQQALQRFKKVVLIGTDCPSLTSACIQTAVQQLNQHDAVMIPATDGGYVLLGFRQVNESLFSDIIWSTASVATVTQQRMADLGWTLALLPPLHDIDEPKDLVHLPSGWLDSHVNIKVDNS
ncbi:MULTISPECIES: TIGR04282 family arsenosugar biosynthesis glycosyltransferase [unclassified Psychrobacter]|uniref:TIGR04282 family arsenosugar biosynthesis glycosyltransferase n=1 Tax=unclassified Psychrobacter TaxID=196806 RepID=UPI0025B2B414|nr:MULTISPECIES: TIGR04282 family arsenosugar biosynthesis glycosyltransferase [unclassified Psychrobacter]MDN3453340.1 TIGR04282 family arsenosugar biosynthesis glycosyltransferase [Psychrobacter sp. APC 3350]MDN3502216.1 TIGR04282 family arsenosugar biosynthesis glycosyltransferase [Psychrobacter sp. 5A.1]